MSLHVRTIDQIRCLGYAGHQLSTHVAGHPPAVGAPVH